MNTQSHTIYTEITVTPEVARQMLNNCHSEQRNVNQRRVDLYAREMASGNWHEPPYTFDSIAVDENGKLVNGQHRLLAVVKANVTVRFNLLQGVRTPQGLILPAGDIGLARHGAFVTGMSRDDFATTRFLAEYLFSGGTGLLANSDIWMVHHALREVLPLFPKPHRKGFSVAVRSAFVFFWLYLSESDLDRADARAQWMAICSADYELMKPVIQKLYRVLIDRSNENRNGREIAFTKTLWALQHMNDDSIIRIRSISQSAQEIIRFHMNYILTSVQP